MLQRAWRSTLGSCTHPRRLRPALGLTSPRSTRRRKTSVERRALAHAPCGACVKLSSVKQKGLRSNAREGRCCSKLSTRCSAMGGPSMSSTSGTSVGGQGGASSGSSGASSGSSGGSTASQSSTSGGGGSSTGGTSTEVLADVTVRAGPLDRDHTITSFEYAAGAGQVLTLRDEQGTLLPV